MYQKHKIHNKNKQKVTLLVKKEPIVHKIATADRTNLAVGTKLSIKVVIRREYAQEVIRRRPLWE